MTRTGGVAQCEDLGFNTYFWKEGKKERRKEKETKKREKKRGKRKAKEKENLFLKLKKRIGKEKEGSTPDSLKNNRSII